MTLYQNCSNSSAPLNKMAARAKNRKTFKTLLLLNQKMDLKIIIQECFLGDPLQGSYVSGKCQGNLKFFKVREFHNLSGKIEILLKCQGNVREF